LLAERGKPETVGRAQEHAARIDPAIPWVVTDIWNTNTALSRWIAVTTPRAVKEEVEKGGFRADSALIPTLQRKKMMPEI